jgi:Ca2+-binding RTX toxin-like protein
MCDEQCRGSVLAGGAGSDRLRGGSEDDVLSGDGDGPPQPEYIKPELTESGAAGNDTIDGGAGVDEISFKGRRTDVSVDLVAGTSTGAGGEHDSVAGVESVLGGDGDDRLLGDAGENTLQGDVGDDRMDGRGGNDYLLGDLVPNTNEYSVFQTPGNEGADTLRGGAGNDRLDAGSERGDVLSGGPGADTLEDGINGATSAAKVRCGSGRDTIVFAPQGQRLSDCERLLADSGQARFELRPRLRPDGRLRFGWSCVQRYATTCTLGVGVRVGSRKLARRQLSLPRLTRGAFLLRPVRGARRGDVVDIRIGFVTGNVYADGRPVLFTARWRMGL